MDRANKRLTVALTFRRGELMYDASNLCAIEGDLMGDDQQHSRHLTMDIDEENNIDRVNRVLNTSWAEMVELLYPYTKRRIQTAEEPLPWTDRPSAPNVYVIDLSLPEDFSVTTVNLLERLIHDWLVYRVLEDWLSIVNPQASEKWREKAALALEKIQDSLKHRTKPYRITPHGIY
ncbi:MAG: hypothetical protein LUE27_10545 [Clostridia bacterium]|nr:hypothetical protein [Clostridia bacterium]